MLSRLQVKENEKPETVRRRFDGQLGVRAWATPGQDRVLKRRESGHPWWWEGAEQASQSFLDAMGVKLT